MHVVEPAGLAESLVVVVVDRTSWSGSIVTFRVSLSPHLHIKPNSSTEKEEEGEE